MLTTPASQPAYNYRVIRRFLMMSVVWGVLGTLAGLWLLLQLSWPQLVPGLEYLAFGRLRPVHGLMLLYGFVVNGLFAIAGFVVQRTAQLRLANDLLSAFSFWGLQAVVLLGAIAGLGGWGQGGGLFDLPWALDLLLALVWLAWLWSFFTTLARRSRAPVYVANWFFGSFAVMVALVHVLSNLALPVTLIDSSSYPLFSGGAESLLQQWQWHVVNAGLLTGAMSGALYYLLPRRLNRPLYSQALASANFWLLLLSSAWIGGAYLHWRALPEWVGSIGTGFSILFVVAVIAAPLNGLLTLRGAGWRVLRDPLVGFLVAAMLLLLVGTLAGTAFAFREFGSLSLDSGWAGAQLHTLALGWAAPLVFAGLYFIVPRVWEAQRFSHASVTAHLLLAVAGALVYLAGHWLGGLGQAFALSRWDVYGGLALGFVETLSAHQLPNLLRLAGGAAFLIGLLMLGINLGLTGYRARQERIELDRLLAGRLKQRMAGARAAGGGR